MASREEKLSNSHPTPINRLLPLLPLLIGTVLVYLGFVIRGLDFGSCPTLGFNGVTAPCFHYFPGTDIPTTPAGDMVIIIGGVAIVTTVVLVLHAHFARRKSGVGIIQRSKIPVKRNIEPLGSDSRSTAGAYATFQKSNNPLNMD